MKTSFELESQNEEHRWEQRKHDKNMGASGSGSSNCFSLGLYGSNDSTQRAKCSKLEGFGFGFGDEDDEDVVSRVAPAVTVVLEGRSICHRISLHKHDGYQSLAKALRQMFVEDNDDDDDDLAHTQRDDILDLSNAIPGHLVAYEDLENDLLLAGDLNWK